MGSTSAARFQATLTRLVAFVAIAGDGDLVLVSHGDAVSAAVNLVDPTAMVYAVDYCGWVTLQSEGPNWKLVSQAGQNGVKWMES